MKKIFCLICTIIMSLAVFSCKAEVDLTAYISELRENVYVGEIEGVKITVYAEKRETPFIADSYVGEMKNILIVKIDNQNAMTDGASIEISYDKITKNGDFEYHPIGGKYVTTIEVDALPKSAQINAKLKCNGLEREMLLLSAISSDSITPKQALDSIKKHDKKTVEEVFESGKVEAEIHVRIMPDGERNFYYVGFALKNGDTKAYLIDGKSGEILAKKTTKI